MTPRLDPWSTAIPDDYSRVMEEFGIQPFEPLVSKIPDPIPLMRRKVVFGHRDFERVLKALVEGKPYAVMTGLMPSGKMHFGHKMVIDQLRWYQNRNAEIFLCVADLEAYSARGVSFQESKRLATEEYLANYEALGLDIEQCSVYFQSRNRSVQDLAFLLAKKVTFSTVRAIYGFEGETGLSAIYYPMIDVADILHPQLEEFGGPRPTVVPVGVDQDPHLRLARDLAAKFQPEFGFVLPSSTYHRLLPGLLGEKMSSSKPETAIFLTDDDRTVTKKLRNAFTGGKPTAEEQRKNGGNPDICRIYELYLYHLMPDDEELLEIREQCRSGKIICGECKQKAIDLVLEFLREHRDRYEDALPKAKKLVERITR